LLSCLDRIVVGCRFGQRLEEAPDAWRWHECRGPLCGGVWGAAERAGGGAAEAPRDGALLDQPQLPHPYRCWRPGMHACTPTLSSTLIRFVFSYPPPGGMPNTDGLQYGIACTAYGVPSWLCDSPTSFPETTCQVNGSVQQNSLYQGDGSGSWGDAGELVQAGSEGGEPQVHSRRLCGSTARGAPTDRGRPQHKDHSAPAGMAFIISFGGSSASLSRISSGWDTMLYFCES
jgi:hypothetical protein